MKLTEQQQELVTSCLRLARKEAWRQAYRDHQRREIEEYTSMALEGLCQAALAYDPGRGVAFTSYAVPVIRNFFASQWQHQRLKKRRCPGKLLLASSLEEEDPRAPSEGDKTHGWWAGPAPENPPGWSLSWLDYWCRKKLISKREAYILKEMFVAERTLQDLACELGISKQAVHQLRKRALKQLRWVGHEQLIK